MKNSFFGCDEYKYSNISRHNTNSPADQRRLDESWDIPWTSASTAEHTYSAAEWASASSC